MHFVNTAEFLFKMLLKTGNMFFVGRGFMYFWNCSSEENRSKANLGSLCVNFLFTLMLCVQTGTLFPTDVRLFS